MAGYQVAYGAKNAKPASVPCHYALWAPGADSGQRKKNEIRGKNSDKKMTAVRDPGVAGW